MAKTASPSIVRALPLLAALTAVVLLLSQLFAWLGIDRAAAAANRAEASLLLDALRAHLHGEGRPPELVDLEPFLSTHRESGLRYAAVRGRLGVSEAGDRQIANEPSDELVADGERLLATDRLGPPPPGFPPPFGLEKGPPRFGHPPHKGKAPRKGTRLGGPRLIVELEPRLGPELRSNAFSALLASSIAAVLFFVLAFTLRRSLRQRELLQAQAEQDRRLATLGEMSSVLAHEIRNPLASLKGHAQLLVETLDGDERRQNKAKRIVGEAVRLEKLTNDLLRFVRSGSLHIAHVSFQELVNEAIESLDEPDRFVMSGPAKDITVQVDRARIHQVLVNVLQNAVQAGEGPVTLELRKEPESLTLKVLDEGPGLRAGDEERIFEPFHTRRTQGTGLGLAIARRIITRHGGSIWAKNRPEGGAVFTIELPIVREA